MTPGVFAAVGAAIERSERLRFDYTDRHHQSSSRRVEPPRLVQVSLVTTRVKIRRPLTDRVA